MKCLLIADDLTGACDAAAPFAARGAHTVVVPSHAAPERDADVVSVSTDTRNRAPAEIRAAIGNLARRFAGAAPRILFKKIDSTLRGNPAVEIAAAREAFGCRTVVACPAFPAMNRVVERGVLRVSLDPGFAPLDVRTVLGCDALDAACDADLDRIVWAQYESPILWAGSAGLAAALARSLNPASSAAPAVAAPSAAPVLFCIGTDHPVTQCQISALLASNCDYLLLRVYLSSTPEALAAAILGSRPGALVVSGGDTAALVCRALGVEAIELAGEVSAGIPRGTLVGGALHDLPVVTKSGGFGAADTLVRIAECLRHQDARGGTVGHI